MYREDYLGRLKRVSGTCGVCVNSGGLGVFVMDGMSLLFSSSSAQIECPGLDVFLHTPCIYEYVGFLMIFAATSPNLALQSMNQ